MHAPASIRTTAILLLSAVLMCFGTAEKNVSHSLIVFEGSDWCANCIRLDKNVLSNDSFRDFIGEVELEVMRLDFPRRKKVADSIASFNRQMADKYAFNGTFPTILLEDRSDGSISELIYRGESASSFIDRLRAIINQTR